MKIYDPDIRELLYKSFLENPEFTSDPSTIVIDEMDVLFGTSRIDIAVINGKIHGFEIKSERDNLERLPSQMDSYNKIFDTITIVVSEKHISKVIEIIPEWWGVYYVEKQENYIKLSKERDAIENSETDLLSLTQLLWRNELLELLSLNGIKKGTKSKNRFALCNMVVENIEESTIRSYIREKLKSRSTWRAVQLQQLYDDLH